jgi:hypothetical protein
MMMQQTLGLGNSANLGMFRGAQLLPNSNAAPSPQFTKQSGHHPWCCPSRGFEKRACCVRQCACV